MDEANADKSWDTNFETIRICALETIPRGKIKKYKPFWTMELADLKSRRDRARIQAELMALTLAKHYASVCRLSRNKLIGPNFPGTPVGCLNQEDDQLLNDKFTYNELRKAMDETKKGKSTGPDDLPAEFFLNLDSQSEILTLCSLRNSDSIEVEEVREKIHELNSTLTGLLYFNGSLEMAASQEMKRQTLWRNMAAIAHSLLVACHADSPFQIFPDPWENTFAEFRRMRLGERSSRPCSIVQSKWVFLDSFFFCCF
ncbi:uncharacterized protein TNCV_497991 [Trichonephila clavipes]|nr:uncharacterized protein TNCV_497991 [Trichonephila clavipes]